MARLVTARQVLSPPSRAACARACGARCDAMGLSTLVLSKLALAQLWLSEQASRAQQLHGQALVAPGLSQGVHLLDHLNGVF